MPALDALETATRLVEAPDVEALFTVLCADAFADFDADWSAVLHRLGQVVEPRRRRRRPSPAWLVAFIEGSKVSEALAAGASGPDDVAWAPLPAAGHELVLGRKGRPLRGRERRRARRARPHRRHPLASPPLTRPSKPTPAFSGKERATLARYLPENPEGEGQVAQPRERSTARCHPA